MRRSYAHLQALLRCHSTPGDEGEVAALLAQCWRRAGWRVQAHGQYAISATLPPTGHRGQGARGRQASRKRVLVCAHMDSPGFTVDSIRGERVRLVTLGGAHVEKRTVELRLKTRAGDVRLECERRQAREHKYDVFYGTLPTGAQVLHGDRACYATEPRLDLERSRIVSPFLDNRLGCALLCDLAEALNGPGAQTGAEVILAATACEEMGGFGAAVLAPAIKPDLVICLDATYEAPSQGVRLGQGPVLTLSDNSVLLGPHTRDQVTGWFAARQLPLQTEVYNYSGTDARAFPHAGLTCPVLPLLLATRGNHEPRETGSLRDYDTLLAALRAMAAAPLQLRGPAGTERS